MFNHGTTVHVDVLPIVEKAIRSAAVTMRLSTDKAEVFKAQFEVLSAASLARGRLSAKSSGGGGARGKSRDKSEDSEGEERNSLAEKIDALLAGGAKDKEVASLLEKALSGRRESMSSTASTDMRMAMLLSPALSKPFSTQKMVSMEEALNGESRKVLREIKEAYKVITSMAEQFIEQSSAYCPAMCFYFKNGTCTYGAKCRFSHDIDAAPAKVVNAGKGGKGKRDQAGKPEQQNQQFQGGKGGKSGKGGKGGKGKGVAKETYAPKSLVVKETNASKGGGGKHKSFDKGCFICGDPKHFWGDDKFHNDSERKACMEMINRQYSRKSNGAAAADNNSSDE
jgi:hypothetical protein